MTGAEDIPVEPKNVAITAEQFSRHVHQLAGVIRERNVNHPQALQAAEDYIQQ
jgi:hypothetical protein